MAGNLLAVSFGVYGAIKKKGGYPAVEAIAVESAVMTPVAIVFAIVLAFATEVMGSSATSRALRDGARRASHLGRCGHGRSAHPVRDGGKLHPP